MDENDPDYIKTLLHDALERLNKALGRDNYGLGYIDSKLAEYVHPNSDPKPRILLQADGRWEAFRYLDDLL